MSELGTNAPLQELLPRVLHKHLSNGRWDFNAVIKLLSHDKRTAAMLVPAIKARVEAMSMSNDEAIEHLAKSASLHEIIAFVEEKFGSITLEQTLSLLNVKIKST